MELKADHPLGPTAEIYINGLTGMHRLWRVDTDKGEYEAYVEDANGHFITKGDRFLTRTAKARVRIVDPATGYEWCSYDREDLVPIDPKFLPEGA